MTASSQEYYIALDTDAEFAAWLKEWKHRVRELVGPQPYLDDPPHVTLYVAAFDDPADAAAAVEFVVASFARGDVAPLRSALSGWHVFPNDPATGGHTLVCELDAPLDSPLRRLQYEAVRVAAGRRNVAATLRLFPSGLAAFGATERADVERFGFPYVGAVWRPHLTVASVRPGDWEPVRHAFESSPPYAGLVSFPTLSLRSVATSELFHSERLHRPGE